MSQMSLAGSGEMILADVAPRPPDPVAQTQAPLPASSSEPISIFGLIVIAIAVFVLVFLGLKRHSDVNKR